MAVKGKILYDLKGGKQNRGGYSSRNAKKDEIVYRFPGATYGIISDEGVAVTNSSEEKEPFFEIPKEAVEWEK